MKKFLLSAVAMLVVVAFTMAQAPHHKVHHRHHHRHHVHHPVHH